MRLVTKLFSGYIIILLLIVFVACVGYIGMSRVIGGVDNTDDVNQLVKGVLRVRQAEKNFIIRGEQSYADEVAMTVEGLLKQAEETKTKFIQKLNKDQMDLVAKAIGEYASAFEAYRDLENRKSTIMNEMKTRAQETMEKVTAIQRDQEVQLLETRKVLKWWTTSFSKTTMPTRLSDGY
jgi:methyl-accepting chemotaxis protein